MLPERVVRALAERYRLGREIGRGGMAAVHVADDLKHGRRVAVKFMDPDVAAAIGPDRFLREIEIAARLTHPHILPLFDSGAVEGRLYYVMPYVEGESLRERLDREQQLPLADALRLTREIASALSHAHQHGLIHRDVKPENVLLADGMALVADFGIARVAWSGDPVSTAAATQRGTTAGTVLGTPRYMPPEQATGGAVDARGDLYSLACVLHEMLAGAPPFVAPTADALVRMHLTAVPRPVTELRPTVPPGVAAAILRALSKIPADRFAGMAPFVEAITVGASQRPTPTPTPVTTAETPHNLPRQRSRFIGRNRELAECARLLGDTRLLTLTGVGGSGKTRLALRLAEGLLESYPDGVWFVDLAAVETEPLLAEVAATTLGARGEPGRSTEASIVEHLRGRRALVILDNCEHLLGPVGDLADRLLGALPELRLIATSREGLGIEGERLFAVRSLGLPRPGEEADLEALQRTEAVSLFVARARDLGADFSLDRAGAGIVADICRRLDGIPLAIELAAARTRALSLEQIARLLDDRFRLLTGGSRSVLERHRTLRATVQWSYDHLDDEERDLFTTLSVFAGGWTLDAAAGVAGRDTFEVLDRLTRLIDKSLVLAGGDRGAEARYRMLETLRQFGLEMLAGSGRADTTRAAHFRFYLGVTKGLEAELSERFPIAAVARLEQDVDNLRAALTWAYQHDATGAVDLTRRLLQLWYTAGHYSEGRRWYGRMLALEGALAPPERASAVMHAGRLAFQQGDYDEALRLYREGLGIHRSLGDLPRTARDLVRTANVLTYRGRHDEARAYYAEAGAILEGLDDRDGAGRLMTAMGLSAYLQGDLGEARRCFETSLATYRPLENLDRIQVSLGNLGLVDVVEGDAARARAHLRECMAINRRLRNLYGCVNFLPALAETLRLEGDATTGARLIGAADALLDQIGAALEAMEQSVYDRAVAALRAGLGEEAFERARLEGRAWSWEQASRMAGE